MRAHIKHWGRVGFVQPRRDPGALAGGALQPQPHPHLSGRVAGPGPQQRRAGICRTKTRADPSPSPTSHLRSGAADPDRAVQEAHPGGGVPAPARSSASRAPGTTLRRPEGHPSTGFLPANPAPPGPSHILFGMTGRRQRCPLVAGRGPGGPRLEQAGRARGRRRLRRKSLPSCGCCSHSPPASPSTRVFFSPFFLQRSCYGLPGWLPWVTRPRPPARYLPPSRPGGAAREGGGGSARVRGAARGGGASAEAAANRRPRGSGGSASARGAGAKL